MVAMKVTMITLLMVMVVTKVIMVTLLMVNGSNKSDRGNVTDGKW